MPLFHLLALVFLLFAPVPALSQGYDSGAPCGRDAYGNPLPCHDVRPNILEATCMTSADPNYCLPYHQRACQTGFALACRMAQMGQHCRGGDPRQCQYYMSVLRANTDCNVNGNPNACAWLQQQNL